MNHHEISDEVLLARAYLSRVAEPACVPVWRFVRQFGPVAAAARIAAGEVPEAVRSATAARAGAADPGADLEAAERHGVRLVAPESPEWPHFAFGALERAADARVARYAAGERAHSESGEPLPPLALWVRGGADLAVLGTRSVSIVGSRAATGYGVRVTSDLGYGLAGQQVIVVSGGAHGIDAAAHRAALAAGAQTVLVSAGGLDRPYPPGNATLFERVAESGLLISESPPGCAPQRQRFLTRNRLIAALGAGTVVVEAAARSGAANTAKHALTLGRPLMVVPGPVTSTMSAGCHDLLRRDPHRVLLVTCLEDVLEVLGGAGRLDDPAGRPDSAGGGDIRADLDRLDPTARRVFDGLPARRYVTPEELAARSGVSPLEVIRALPALELAGLAESGEAGHRIAARIRREGRGGARADPVPGH